MRVDCRRRMSPFHHRTPHDRHWRHACMRRIDASSSQKITLEVGGQTFVFRSNAETIESAKLMASQELDGGRVWGQTFVSLEPYPEPLNPCSLWRSRAPGRCPGDGSTGGMTPTLTPLD